MIPKRGIELKKVSTSQEYLPSGKPKSKNILNKEKRLRKKKTSLKTQSSAKMHSYKIGKHPSMLKPSIQGSMIEKKEPQESPKKVTKAIPNKSATKELIQGITRNNSQKNSKRLGNFDSGLGRTLEPQADNSRHLKPSKEPKLSNSSSTIRKSNSEIRNQKLMSAKSTPLSNFRNQDESQEEKSQDQEPGFPKVNHENKVHFHSSND